MPTLARDETARRAPCGRRRRCNILDDGECNGDSEASSRMKLIRPRALLEFLPMFPVRD